MVQGLGLAAEHTCPRRHQRLICIWVVRLTFVQLYEDLEAPLNDVPQTSWHGAQKAHSPKKWRHSSAENDMNSTRQTRKCEGREKKWTIFCDRKWASIFKSHRNKNFKFSQVGFTLSKKRQPYIVLEIRWA